MLVILRTLPVRRRQLAVLFRRVALVQQQHHAAIRLAADHAPRRLKHAPIARIGIRRVRAALKAVVVQFAQQLRLQDSPWGCRWK